MFLINTIKHKKFILFFLICFNVNSYHNANGNNDLRYFINSPIDPPKPPKKSILEKTVEIAAPIALSILTVLLEVYFINKMLEEPAFKVYQPGEIKETFASVAGNDEAKEALNDIVQYLKNPEVYKTVGARPTTGILLTGAPGTGKTLLARAMAGEANCAFIYASGSEFNGKFVGSGVTRIKKLFGQAHSQRNWWGCGKKTPCIIFIDEFEILAKQRGVGFDNYSDQTVNELLTQLDGFIKTQEDPVIVIAATNYPQKIDAAITRPGRIDRTIHISPANCHDRINTLKLHLQKVNHVTTINLLSIAQRTIGFTGADLAEIVNAAARIAANRKASFVEQQDLEEALDMRTIGVASKQPLSEKERTVVAYHEAGHALISMLCLPDRTVNKITIIPRGQALGVTHTLLTDEPSRIETQDDYLNLIAMMLGGRAAEDIIFNIISTGPSSDLNSATTLAQGMIKYYGMGDDLVVETLRTDLPEATVHAQVAIILQKEYQRTKDLLLKHIDQLHKLAKALLEKETLFIDDIKALRLV